jgi:hypothetical protein
LTGNLTGNRANRARQQMEEEAWQNERVARVRVFQ